MQNIKIKFVYKRGFRRAWAVLSVIWLIAIILLNFDDGEPLTRVFMAGILPPIILYAIGAALVWIIEGFAKPDH